MTTVDRSDQTTAPVPVVRLVLAVVFGAAASFGSYLAFVSNVVVSVPAFLVALAIALGIALWMAETEPRVVAGLTVLSGVVAAVVTSSRGDDLSSVWPLGPYPLVLLLAGAVVYAGRSQAVVHRLPRFPIAVAAALTAVAVVAAVVVSVARWPRAPWSALHEGAAAFVVPGTVTGMTEHERGDPRCTAPKMVHDCQPKVVRQYDVELDGSAGCAVVRAAFDEQIGDRGREDGSYVGVDDCLVTGLVEREGVEVMLILRTYEGRVRVTALPRPDGRW